MNEMGNGAGRRETRLEGCECYHESSCADRFRCLRLAGEKGLHTVGNVVVVVVGGVVVGGVVGVQTSPL